MKKIILLVLCTTSLFAQEDNPELYGKWLKAKVLFYGVDSAEVLMRYQPAAFFSRPNNAMSFSKTWTEAEVNGSNAPAGAYQSTSTTVQSFKINNKIWALRPVPGQDKDQFVMLQQQGAIERYQYVAYTSQKTEADFIKNGSTTYWMISRKLGGQGFTILEMNEKREREWVSDSPEIVKELKTADSVAAINKVSEEKKKDSIAQANKGKEKPKSKGLMGALKSLETMSKDASTEKPMTATDLTTIIHNYNAWYEKNNPGKIKYFWISPPTRGKSQLEANQEKLAAQAEVDRKNAEKQKKKDDFMASRPAVAAAAFASAKDNTPVKKETFTAKLDRIKADGNRVGVMFVLNSVKGYPKSSGMSTNTMMSAAITLEGEYMDESLQSLGKDFTAELNAALGRTDIELIDMSNIPLRTIKVLGTSTQIDDWWVTQYKVVFAYTVDPKIRATHESFGGDIHFEASLNFTSPLLVTEYIGGAGSKDQDIITQINNMGFSTPSLSQKEDILDVKILYEKTAQKLTMPLSDKIKSERAESVKKLIEKKLK